MSFCCFVSILTVSMFPTLCLTTSKIVKRRLYLPFKHVETAPPTNPSRDVVHKERIRYAGHARIVSDLNFRALEKSSQNASLVDRRCYFDALERRRCMKLTKFNIDAYRGASFFKLVLSPGNAEAKPGIQRISLMLGSLGDPDYIHTYQFYPAVSPPEFPYREYIFSKSFSRTALLMDSSKDDPVLYVGPVPATVNGRGTFFSAAYSLNVRGSLSGSTKYDMVLRVSSKNSLALRSARRRQRIALQKCQRRGWREKIMCVRLAEVKRAYTAYRKSF